MSADEVSESDRRLSEVLRSGMEQLTNRQLGLLAGVMCAGGVGHFQVIAAPIGGERKAYAVVAAFSGPCTPGDVNRLTEYLQAWHQDLTAGRKEILRVDVNEIKAEDHET